MSCVLWKPILSFSRNQPIITNSNFDDLVLWPNFWSYDQIFGLIQTMSFCRIILYLFLIVNDVPLTLTLYWRRHPHPTQTGAVVLSASNASHPCCHKKKRDLEGTILHARMIPRTWRYRTRSTNRRGWESRPTTTTTTKSAQLRMGQTNVAAFSLRVDVLRRDRRPSGKRLVWRELESYNNHFGCRISSTARIWVPNPTKSARPSRQPEIPFQSTFQKHFSSLPFLVTPPCERDPIVRTCEWDLASTKMRREDLVWQIYWQD